MTRSNYIRLDTKPRVTVAILVVVVITAGLIPLLVWRGARAIIKSNEGHSVTTSGLPVAQLPPTPVGLIVRAGADGHARDFVLISALPKQAGGWVIQVPADVRVDIVDRGTNRLADAFDIGGVALVKQALESLLQIAIQSADVVDPSALVTLLQPYQPFRFTLDQPILNYVNAVRTDTVLPAGAIVLNALDVPRFLDARLNHQAQLEVLPRQELLWRAVVASVKSRAQSPAAAGTNAAWIASLGPGQHAVGTLAVDASGQADVARARLLVAQAMPGAVSPAVDGKRYRLVNTTGDIGVAVAAVNRVIAAGGSVIWESDASPPATKTLFEFGDDANAAFAASLVPSFKTGVAQKGTQRIEGIDVTVTLGRGFAAVAAAEAAAPATTTTAPSTTATSST